MYKEFILKARGCEYGHGNCSVRFAFTTANSKKNKKHLPKKYFTKKTSL